MIHRCLTRNSMLCIVQPLFGISSLCAELIGIIPAQVLKLASGAQLGLGVVGL